MTDRTLMLTSWMTPARVISWQRAIVLVYLGRAEVLEEYDTVVRGPSITLRTPAVVRMVRGRSRLPQGARFSRKSVFARDGHRCQYCGRSESPSRLTFDHVVPRASGGATSWENIVTCCHPCNARKGSRTPEQAGMPLLRRPRRPSGFALAALAVTSSDVPSAWTDYCVTPAADADTEVA